MDTSHLMNDDAISRELDLATKHFMGDLLLNPIKTIKGVYMCVPH